VQALMTTAPAIARATGFTLIELMIVVLIAVILITIGVPYLGDYVADQRVRTVTSDIASDIAFTRAKAIEESRRATITRTGADWSGGWRIWVDLDGDGAYDAGEEVKITQGVTGGSNRLRACALPLADFGTNITFRPDGRIVRTTAAAATDGIYVIDEGRDAAVTDNAVRGVLFGTSGRTSTVRLNGTAPPC